MFEDLLGTMLWLPWFDITWSLVDSWMVFFFFKGLLEVLLYPNLKRGERNLREVLPSKGPLFSTLLYYVLNEQLNR